LPDAFEENELKFKPTNGPYQGKHLHRRGNFILNDIPVGEFNPW